MGRERLGASTEAHREASLLLRRASREETFDPPTLACSYMSGTLLPCEAVGPSLTLCTLPRIQAENSGECDFETAAEVSPAECGSCRTDAWAKVHRCRGVLRMTLKL